MESKEQIKVLEILYPNIQFKHNNNLSIIELFNEISNHPNDAENPTSSISKKKVISELKKELEFLVLTRNLFKDSGLRMEKDFNNIFCEMIKILKHCQKKYGTQNIYWDLLRFFEREEYDDYTVSLIGQLYKKIAYLEPLKILKHYSNKLNNEEIYFQILLTFYTNYEKIIIENNFDEDDLDEKAEIVISILEKFYSRTDTYIQMKIESDAKNSSIQHAQLIEDKKVKGYLPKNNTKSSTQKNLTKRKSSEVIISKKIILMISKIKLKSLFKEVHEYLRKEISEVEITNLLSKFSEHEDKFDNQTIDVDTFEPTIWKGELTLLIYLFDKLQEVNIKLKTPIIVFQENIHDQIAFYFRNKNGKAISPGTLKTELSAFKKTEKRKDFDEFYNVMISNL